MCRYGSRNETAQAQALAKDYVKRLKRRIRQLEEELAVVAPDSDEWLRLQDELAEASAQLAAMRAPSAVNETASARPAERMRQQESIGPP